MRTAQDIIEALDKRIWNRALEESLRLIRDIERIVGLTIDHEDVTTNEDGSIIWAGLHFEHDDYLGHQVVRVWQIGRSRYQYVRLDGPERLRSLLQEAVK